VGRVVALADAVLKAVPVASLSCWNPLSDRIVLVEEYGIRKTYEVPA
jgi:hypothetical protein